MDKKLTEKINDKPLSSVAEVIENPPNPDARILGESCVKDEHEKGEKEDEQRKALANLMMRIAEHVDLPTVKESIGKVRRVVHSDRSHINQVSDLVLNDVGLSGKLLRIINAAFYSTGGAGSITSIQRAVALMGFESVEMLAASLTLFDRVPKGRDGDSARESCRHSLMAGWLAQNLCNSARHVEAVYLPALFVNLGQMLVSMHAPASARLIKKKIKDALARQTQLRQSESDTPSESTNLILPTQQQLHEITQQAARDIFGVTFEDIGVDVARQWGWPQVLANQLRSFYGTDPGQVAENTNYIRALCTAASEFASALNALPVDGSRDVLADAQSECLQTFYSTWGQALSLDKERLQSVAELAFEQREIIADFLEIAPEKSADLGMQTRFALPFQPKRVPMLAGPNRVSVGLNHALKVMENSIETAAPFEEVIQQLMFDLFEVLRLQRVVVCLRDSAAGGLRGAAGHGSRALTVSTAFQVPLGESPDLFSVLCASARDAIVTDSADPVILKHLPPWYFQKVGARTFGVLPLTHRYKVRGLIYVDRQMAGSLVLTDAELKLLQTVRDRLLKIMIDAGV